MYFSLCYWILFGLTCLLSLFALRVLFLVFEILTNKRKTHKRSSQDKVKTVIVIGSGGHSTEMLYLVERLNLQRYSPRMYLMANSDTWSEQKVHEYEKKIGDKGSDKNYNIYKIPRSRSVHQSYFTSIFTSLYSVLASIPVMLKFKPDLVLCNGPGTCIPICVIAFLMRCAFVSNNTIIFIESICRVKSMSLSGKILQWIADEILVQWEELTSKCTRANYIGRVI